MASHSYNLRSSKNVVRKVEVPIVEMTAPPTETPIDYVPLVDLQHAVFALIKKVGYAINVPFLSLDGKPNKLLLQTEEELIQVMLKTDSIVCDGNDYLRQQRRQLVKSIQDLLYQIDLHKIVGR